MIVADIYKVRNIALPSVHEICWEKNQFQSPIWIMAQDMYIYWKLIGNEIECIFGI